MKCCVFVSALLVILAWGFSAQASFETDTIPYAVVGRDVDGMKVLSRLPASLGLAKIGVQSQDIVLDVDGNSISNLESARQAYRCTHPQTVTVLRNGKLVRLEQP